MAAPQSVRMDDAGSPEMCIRLPPEMCRTDDQFFEFCRVNSELRIERDAGKGVRVRPPVGWDTARKNARISLQLLQWADADGTGEAADSSAGYRLPNGAIRSPDASWVSNERLAAVPLEQRTRFLPLCPDFVIELRSPSDSLPTLQEKMVEYAANGALLGWLIDPLSRRVLVYRPGREMEEVAAPVQMSGEPLLRGFRLQMAALW